MNDLWTLSIELISVMWWGDQIWGAYSRRGLTYVMKALTRIEMSRDMKQRWMSAARFACLSTVEIILGIINDGYNVAKSNFIVFVYIRMFCTNKAFRALTSPCCGSLFLLPILLRVQQYGLAVPWFSSGAEQQVLVHPPTWSSSCWCQRPSWIEPHTPNSVNYYEITTNIKTVITKNLKARNY